MIGFIDDDGRIESYTILFPLLERFGFNGSFAIVPNWINKIGYMTIKQILELQKAGHEIMSHSVTHPDLTNISLSEAINELEDSKRILEDLGINIYNFVFPYNKTNIEISYEALKIYKGAFCYNASINNFPIQFGNIKRITIRQKLYNLKPYVKTIIENNGNSALFFVSHSKDWEPGKRLRIITKLFQYIKDKSLTIRTTKEILDKIKINHSI